MSWLTIWSFAAIAAVLVMSPGPNGLLIARTVPVSGRAAGFANVAGFVCAFYLHGAMMVLGVSVLLVRSAELFTLVKLLGAAYLCWLGLKALRDAFRGATLPRPDRDSPPRAGGLAGAFAEGFVTNALNPKVSMFYLAAFPQFLPLGQATPSNVLTLVFIHSMLNMVWFGAMVLVLARLSAFARRDEVQRWIKGVAGAVFLGFGIKLATMRA